MHSEIAIAVAAPPELVFALAHDVEGLREPAVLMIGAAIHAYLLFR